MKNIFFVFILFFTINSSFANNDFEKHLKFLYPNIKEHTLELYKTDAKKHKFLFNFIKDSVFNEDQNGIDSYFLFQFFKIVSNDFETIKQSQFVNILCDIKKNEYNTLKAVNFIISYFTLKALNLSTPICPASKNVSKLFNTSIKQLRDLLQNCESNDDGSFLRPFQKIRKAPTELYDQFAKQLKKYSNDAEENIPFFAELAALHLKNFLYSENFLKDYNATTIIAFTALAQDIIHAYQTGEANYKWFLIINKRMMVMEQLHKHQTNLSFNTSFDAYLSSYFDYIYNDPYGILSHIGIQDYFEKSINNFANIHTQKRCSIEAYIDLYPHVVFLHFPFELTDTDLIRPLNNKISFWPLGFSFKNISADGAKFTPAFFELHDNQHFNILRNLSIISFDVTNYTNKETFHTSEFINKLKKHVTNGIRLFVKWSKHINKIVDEETDPILKKYFSFFAFLILHEDRVGLTERLKIIFDEEEFINHNLKNVEESDLFNEQYYLPLLPKSLLTIKKLKERENMLIQMAHQFYSKINIQLEKKLGLDTEQWLKKYNTSNLHLPVLQEHTTLFDPLAYKIKINPDSITNINDHKIYTYHMKNIKNFPKKGSPEEKELFHSVNTILSNDDQIKETTIIYRYVFNSILPDGKEIEMKAPFWIEEFIVDPAD